MIRLAAPLVAATALVLAGCSSSPKVSAPVLLERAKARADSSSSVHFVLTSQNVSLTGTNLVNGQGDLERPDSLRGTFSVAVKGFTAAVKVVSVNGIFEAQVPFATHFEKANPSDFGLSDPGQLLNPSTGLTRLLVLAQKPQLGGQERVNGELLDTVSYTVPGDDIPVLPDENPSTPVRLTVAIDPSNDELRKVTLVGPFTSASSNSTYVVTLNDYNEHVTITLPPTS
jgi:hypothetical protein